MKRKENKKTLSIVMTVFIALSMVISIFAIVIDNYQTDQLSYNKHSFKMTNTGYKTMINGKYMDFQYFPSDLERINLSDNAVNILKQSQGIVFLFDPNSSVEDLTFIDFIRFELPTQINKSIYFTITQNSSLYPLTVAGCENSTPQFPFVLINISSDSVYRESAQYPNCIVMNAKLRDIIALKDRLVYRMAGIMEK